MVEEEISLEIKIAKYLMILLILIMAGSLIWGGHQWGIAKGELKNGQKALDILSSPIFTPAVPVIPEDCLSEEGC